MRLLFFLLILNIALVAEDDKKNNASKNSNNNEVKPYISSIVKDTLYTLSDYFIEVNLATQKAFLHSRYDSTKSFGVSTGTKKIKDGVETNEGIYAIQFKVKKWYSSQFDSTLMLNFMTFNWGIGFHALSGNSYYKYLGVKKSSHGCVRISRQIATELYQKISYGTPVIVHDGNPAVWIDFANQSDKNLKYFTYPELKHELNLRIQKLYRGEYLLFTKPKLLIDHYNVTHSGLPVGNGSQISRYQIIKPDYMFLTQSMPETKQFELLQNNLLNLHANVFQGKHLSSP